MTQRFFRVSPMYAAVIAAAMLMTACGGGGGGGGKGVKPSDPAPVSGTAAPQNTARVTVSGGSTVLVGVTDTGARLSHAEMAGVVAGTYNVLTGSADVSDNHGHGTAVASEIAGKNVGYSGNARLLIAKISDNGVASTDDLARGVGWSVDNGARVVNSSYSGWEYFSRNVAQPQIQKIASGNAVWVVAAGNSTLDLSQSLMTLPETAATTTLLAASNAAVAARTIIVGAMDGTNLRSTSNYPGSDSRIQAMFMTANGAGQTTAVNTGDNDYGTFSGTSAAAPEVAAAAATLTLNWPALTSDQIRNLLLTRAKRTNPLYSQNTCGVSATENCGYFFLGQGELDLAAAMGPLGTLSFPTGTTVASASSPITSAGIVASPAFGDALGNIKALASVAAFDDIGRDYRINLSGAVASRKSAAVSPSTVRNFVAKTSSPVSRFAYAYDDENGVSALTRYNDDGSIASSLMSLRQQDVTISAFHFQQGEADPSAVPDALVGLPMLSYTAANEVSNSFAQTSGAGASLSLSDGVRIEAKMAMSNNADVATSRSGTSALRTEVAMAYSPTSWMSVRLGMATLREDASTLGATSYGALALNRGDSNFLSQVFGMDLRPTDHVSLFARLEQGRMANLSGGTLFQSLNDVRASKYALGAALNAGGGVHAALTYSSPLRVDSATVRMSMPTGRTIDGAVTFAADAVKLAPSGRERTVELAMAAPAGKTGTVQMNVARTFEPGHVAGAKAQNTAVISYGYRF